MTYGPTFEDKAVFVVGGSRGIGAAVVRRFARLGACVAIGHRTADDAAAALAEEIAPLNVNTPIISGDISKTGQAESMVRAAYEALGRLDILVNTAGINPYVPLASIDEKHYRSVFDTNVLGSIMLTQAAASLLAAPGGRIVHVASRLAYDPFPSSSVYAASKAAVIALVHGFARELGPIGITVNAVAPGLVETDMTRDAIIERGKQICASTPLGRIGQPEDIAGIVTFLASDDASWITGRTILADGGIS